jgi:hypothetical protein
MGNRHTKHISSLLAAALLSLTFASMGCSESGFQTIRLSSTLDSKRSDNRLPNLPADPGKAPVVVPTPSIDPIPAPVDTTTLGFCPRLAFAGVQWPMDLSFQERTLLGLALDISGSFEGSDGWANLTNDFDAQGVSMGLLNQNLGQGSLQPLWVQMRNRYPMVLASLVQPTHLQSMLSMLERWDGNKLVSVASVDEGTSPLDIDYQPRVHLLSGSTSDGVTWARQNLYTDGGSTFTSAWKKELTALGTSPFYVTIQIEAAMKMHDKTLAYMKSLKLKEFRSYLMLFDIVVQNGSVRSDVEAEYADYLAKNPGASEDQRLNKLLALRLVWVNPQYEADVKSRKQALIDGTGKVHGTTRNFEKEYCFNRTTAVGR